MKKFYITTPIYYPNDIPHLGHAYTTIAADVLARFHRMLGENVKFTTGTDEHGQKIEEAAKKAGKGTKEFVDELIPRFKDAWTALNISYDDFVRTTEQRHKDAVVELIKKCHENGDIYKGEYEGLYCTGCEAYYLEKDLVDGCCPIHKKKAELVKEESYFFRMSKYQDELLKFYKENPNFLSPTHKKDEIINRVKEGLNDLSITRTSFKWGIPFPYDDKHITYVWFDALTNYITSAGFPDHKKEFETFWPADVHLVGKDIMWFHQVIWPTMLMSAKLPLPKKVFAHGWWTVDGQKMSKSLGNVIEPIKIAKEYGTDELRYFLLREAPFGEDGDFAEKAFMQRINAELADDLGNLLSRAVVFVEKNFDGVIPAMTHLEKVDEELIKESNIFSDYKKHMDNLEFNDALSIVWKFIQATNKYVNDTAPWKIKDKDRLSTAIYNICESLRIISIYVEPFMPAKAHEIRAQLGIKEIKENFTTLDKKIKNGTKVHKANHLFKKYDLAAYEKEHQEKLRKEKEEKDKLKPADFSLLNLKVAKIVSCKDHPDAEKLFVIELDIGHEKRQLVAGLRAYYKADELVGKHIILVSNLKPAKLRGIQSQGMLLAADKGSIVKILEAPHSKAGTQVHVQGYSVNNEQIEYADFAKVKMTTKGKVAVYNNLPLHTKDGTVSCDIEDGANIR